VIMLLHGYEVFRRRLSGQGVKLASHLHLLTRLMFATILPVPRGQYFMKQLKHAPGFSFYLYPCYPSFVLTDMYCWRNVLSHSCKGTVPGPDVKTYEGSGGNTPLIPNLGFVTRSLYFLTVYQEKAG